MMSLSIGKHVPSLTLKMVFDDQATDVASHDFFNHKKTILFGLPGAFTPVCSARHLPDFNTTFDAFKALGIDQIVCISVNDPFVMTAWAKSLGVEKTIHMACDWDAAFTKALGLTVDLTKGGLGTRSKRYALLIDNNVIQKLEIEEDFTQCSVSSADYWLDLLKKVD